MALPERSWSEDIKRLKIIQRGVKNKNDGRKYIPTEKKKRRKRCKQTRERCSVQPRCSGPVGGGVFVW